MSDALLWLGAILVFWLLANLLVVAALAIGAFRRVGEVERRNRAVAEGAMAKALLEAGISGGATSPDAIEEEAVAELLRELEDGGPGMFAGTEER